MSFSFQIHNDLQFDHNEEVLKIADDNTPELFHTPKTKVHFVKCVKDPDKLGGWGVQQVEADWTRAYGKGDSLILDFGEHITGTFSIDITSIGSPVDAPLYIAVKFCEMACEIEEDSSTYEGWLSSSWFQEERIHKDVLPCTLQLERRYSFRYVRIDVLDTSPKWKVVFSHPVADAISSAKEAEIPCMEDVQLQKIYATGLHTLHECMQDVFEDGPKRDRRLWLGDLRLQALSNYASYRKTDIVKRCIALFCGMRCKDGRIPANVFVKPAYIPDDTFLYDYSLFLISTVYDYVHETKDIAFLKTIYPVLTEDMDACLQCVDDTGRFHMQKEFPVFVDWADTFDKEVCGSAVTIYALRQLISLGKQMEQDVERYVSVLHKMEDEIRTHLYDQKEHAIRCYSKEINLATQVWMVLSSTFTKEENHAIMQEAVKRFFPVQGVATPYMYHHITEALIVSGMKEEAVTLMKSYWGKMIDLGGDTFFEAFDPDHPDYSPYGSAMINSYCHAWSCTPVYLIRKYIL